jgi:hypothetical protein
MNCCDDYGQCQQGHNCAARQVGPEACISAQCDRLGVCHCPPAPKQHCSAEPTDLDIEADLPMGTWDSVCFWGVVVTASCCTVAVIAGGAGWAVARLFG